ncbi:molybdopterin molybdotransferase MoeA [Ekhidna sp. To15]|uniref:molybdopterin molybdotransferase MoeA n=1 Tax=Ekhidna sp. To15 TaxID=3395267 RepID=UPI003F51FDAD
MVSIEEALALVDQQELNLIPDELPLAQSLGCYLSEKITSPFDLPSFDNSAMDGYAVCGFHNEFEVVGEVAAGSTGENQLSDGKAMRIFTGGKVPEETTAVIMQEKTKVEGSKLILEEEVIVSKNVRRKGAEIAEGQEVFQAGHQINSATIGVLSSLGFGAVKVFQQPTIHVIATGNELVEPGEDKESGQIYESNSQTLAAALQDHGFYCGSRQKISDNLDAIAEGISDNLEQCDVLLITGGISVGDYDFVKEALEENDVEEVFYKVFQKPGKPLYFGRRDEQFVFALPGNPASSLTCFYVYVLPLLQKMSGGRGQGLMKVNLPIAHDHVIKFDRPVFLKASIENNEVTILDGQGSSMIHSMARSNALAFAKGPVQLEKGNPIECLLI